MDPTRFGIPSEFPPVLKGYANACLRENPETKQQLIEFSRDYFTQLAAEQGHAPSAHSNSHTHTPSIKDPYKENRHNNNMSDNDSDDIGQLMMPSNNTRHSLSSNPDSSPKPMLSPFSAKRRILQKPTFSTLERKMPVLEGRKSNFAPAKGKESIDPKARKEAIYRATFLKYDKDNSGSIDVAELKDLMTDLKWSSSEEDIKKATSVLDKDNDGTIDIEEFLKWTQYAWRSMAHSGRKASFSIQGMSAADKKKAKGNRLRRSPDIGAQSGSMGFESALGEMMSLGGLIEEE